jgi:type IV pilus assembly protein PilC
VVIIPKFKEIFQALEGELPWLTQLLIDTSYILVNYTAWVIAGIVGLVFAYKRINHTREGKHFFDRMKLRIPIIGKLFRKTAIVRFSGTLATLITSGVPILQAIDIVRETSGNEVVTRAMDRVYTSVRDGETIHEPLARCKVFPPLVVHMVAVGEETGAIDQMLEKVAEAYEREVEDTVNALTSILEPIMIVFLGALVGVIVVALYLPLFTIPTLINRNAG